MLSMALIVGEYRASHCILYSFQFSCEICLHFDQKKKNLDFFVFITCTRKQRLMEVDDDDDETFESKRVTPPSPYITDDEGGTRTYKIFDQGADFDDEQLGDDAPLTLEVPSSSFSNGGGGGGGKKQRRASDSKYQDLRRYTTSDAGSRRTAGRERVQRPMREIRDDDAMDRSCWDTFESCRRPLIKAHRHKLIFASAATLLGAVLIIVGISLCAAPDSLFAGVIVLICGVIFVLPGCWQLYRIAASMRRHQVEFHDDDDIALNDQVDDGSDGDSDDAYI
jgi:Transmembrane proteins 230/134